MHVRARNLKITGETNKDFRDLIIASRDAAVKNEQHDARFGVCVVGVADL